MKNDSSQKQYAWFDVSSKSTCFRFLLYFISLFKIDNLDDERSWIRKYIEFDRTKRTLTFYSNDVCNFSFFFCYFSKHWMNDWVHQLTSTIKSTFPQLFSTVMYVHQLMSIFHPCAMPHIIASSSLHMRMCVGDTHTHINRMFVRMYWMMEPFFLLLLLRLVLICISAMLEWVPNGELNSSIKERERKKNDGIT